MSASVFECPKCGGQIPYTGNGKTVVCPFCNNTVIVPKELRQTAVQPQVIIESSEPIISSDTVKKGAIGVAGFTLASIGLPIILTCVVTLVIMGAVFFFVNRATSGVKDAILAAVTEQSSGVSNPLQSGSGFAGVALQFGSKGSGPGQFEDARHIGLDANGNIYVAQYIGGRVQVFDPSGKYQTEWSVDRKAPLTGFAVSRKGEVYTAQQGKIARRDGQTGEVAATLSYGEGDWFESIWLMPNQTLVASWYDNRDDIVVFNPKGQMATTIPAAISTVTGDPELDTSVAADGQGNIYAMGSFSNAVFKFSPEGKYIDKFGAEGDGPGQFQALLAIAVDGQGRVYVADIKGVQVFSSDGQYQALIGVSGAPYGLALDDAGNLWVVAGTQVSKYAIHPR